MSSRDTTLCSCGQVTCLWDFPEADVCPGTGSQRLGVATCSPRLDARGDSARGIEACQELAARFGLHAFDCLNAGSSYLDAVL